MRNGPFVVSAMRDLGLRLDTRGLVPLAEARRRVRKAKVFERGAWHVIPNQESRPTDADFLWAALLSLANAEEFVREASRLRWKFSPRGFDNVAPLERYGDAIVPWLARFVDEKGDVARAPWCIVPCLAGIGTKDALAVLLRIRKRPDVHELLRGWLSEHRRPGWKALAELVTEGHELARDFLIGEAKRSPSGVRKSLVSAIGVSKAKTLLSVGGAPAALTEAAILEVLDAAASSSSDDPMPWPLRGASVGHFEPHAMRVVAARSKKGDEWGILFEVVQGDYLEGPDDEIRWPVTIQQYRYGSRVPAGGKYLVDSRSIGMHRVLPRGFAGRAFALPKTFDGIDVVGPKGTKAFSLTDSLVKKLRLDPGRACSARIEDWPSVIAVRARLARDPDAFWTDPRALAKKALKLTDPIILVATSDYGHVSGPSAGAGGPDGRMPSASKTFRSIAAAIVHRDPKRFQAGKPNVDWRRQPRR